MPPIVRYLPQRERQDHGRCLCERCAHAKSAGALSYASRPARDPDRVMSSSALSLGRSLKMIFENSANTLPPVALEAR
jgi:hypothetical protein